MKHAPHDPRLEAKNSSQFQDVAGRDASHVKVTEEFEQENRHRHGEEAEQEEERR